MNFLALFGVSMPACRKSSGSRAQGKQGGANDQAMLSIDGYAPKTLYLIGGAGLCRHLASHPRTGDLLQSRHRVGPIEEDHPGEEKKKPYSVRVVTL